MNKISGHMQYLSEGIPSAKALLPNPLDQFNVWIENAFNNKVSQPEAAALSTVSSKGIPSTRFLLVKGIENNGVVFFTNYKSRKAQELFPEDKGQGVASGQGSYASLAFYWKEIHRSVRFVGKVEKVSQAISEEYFKDRPVGSRIGAWASEQSSVITSRDELEQKTKKFAEKFGVAPDAEDGDIPLPEFWGGIRLVPFEVEFWAGQESRLHDRFRYTRPEGSSDTAWKIDRLAP